MKGNMCWSCHCQLLRVLDFTAWGISFRKVRNPYILAYGDFCTEADRQEAPTVKCRRNKSDGGGCDHVDDRVLEFRDDYMIRYNKCNSNRMSLYFSISSSLAFCCLVRLLTLMRVIARFCPLESEI